MRRSCFSQCNTKQLQCNCTVLHCNCPVLHCYCPALSLVLHCLMLYYIPQTLTFLRRIMYYKVIEGLTAENSPESPRHKPRAGLKPLIITVHYIYQGRYLIPEGHKYGLYQAVNMLFYIPKDRTKERNQFP